MTVMSGSSLAPVRIMEDHTGKTIREASFSTPVTLVGFDQLPEAGSEFHSYSSKRDAESARAALAPTVHTPTNRRKR